MGYSVKKTNYKRRNWKLLLEHNDYSSGKRVKVCKAIPENQFGTHGFRPDMSIEEARSRASILNRDSEEKRHAQKKVVINEQIAAENIKLAATVPDEAKFIEWCKTEERIEFKGPNKHNSHWQCAKRVVSALGLLPPDYFDSRRRIYFWFSDNALSLDYLKKVLRFINLYGRYYSRSYRTFFEEIPYPTGKDREQINDAFFEEKGEGKTAKPLDNPKHLERAKGKFSEENYNWLYLSFWLGLRPLEVDNLKDPKYRRIEVDEHGTTIVWVYQTKLKAIHRDKRWKAIPLLHKEQQIIPELIEAGNFKRPLVKTIRAHLGDGYNTYSGRKGFEPYMRDKHPFDHVSSWLGHQSLDRTWKSYTDKKTARYNKAG